MDGYSKEALDWFDEMREAIRDRIGSFHSLPESVREQYSGIEEYFDWPLEDQQRWGQPGAIESDVDYTWDELKPKTRKELGGKSEAARLVAIILRDEFDIDIVDAVVRHAQPCYLLQDRINEYDWETDEEGGYQQLARFIKDRNLDRGSALQLYWGFSPDYYTRFEKDSELGTANARKAFRLLKKLEKRLLDDDFKTKLIPFAPSLADRAEYEDAKWKIPESLTRPNPG